MDSNIAPLTSIPVVSRIRRSYQDAQHREYRPSVCANQRSPSDGGLRAEFPNRFSIRTIRRTKLREAFRGSGRNARVLKHGASDINKITMVAPTGFGSQASLFEIAFEGLAFAA